MSAGCRRGQTGCGNAERIRGQSYPMVFGPMQVAEGEQFLLMWTDHLRDRRA